MRNTPFMAPCSTIVPLMDALHFGVLIGPLHFRTKTLFKSFCLQESRIEEISSGGDR